MRYALAYGADAVYAGQPRYSLRVRNNTFDYHNLSLGILETHKLGKKFYVVINIIPHNAKLKTFLNDIKIIIDLKPDALIMSDPGLIMLVREYYPTISIHLSVQANTVNWAAVKFWQQIGLTRVILSRELSLQEINEIRKQVPTMEIEVFVHGALCMAYSGRCLISNYINKRDPNQGACSNVCRWDYKINITNENDYTNTQDLSKLQSCSSHTDLCIHAKSAKYQEDISLLEDRHGTYIMNSRDLCAVQHIAKLVNIGVHAFKIEGRTKSFYYCARTAKVYRQAIDDAISGKPFDKNLLVSLDGLANRGYTDGFMYRHKHQELQNYEYSHSISKTQQLIGEFSGKHENNLAELWVKNKFEIGDNVELITPKHNIFFVITKIMNIHNNILHVAPGNGYTVYLPIFLNIDLHFALLLRNLNKNI